MLGHVFGATETGQLCASESRRGRVCERWAHFRSNPVTRQRVNIVVGTLQFVMCRNVPKRCVVSGVLMSSVLVLYILPRERSKNREGG